MKLKLRFDNGIEVTYTNVSHYILESEEREYEEKIKPPSFIQKKLEENEKNEEN